MVFQKAGRGLQVQHWVWAQGLWQLLKFYRSSLCWQILASLFPLNLLSGVIIRVQLLSLAIQSFILVPSIESLMLILFEKRLLAWVSILAMFLSSNNIADVLTTALAHHPLLYPARQAQPYFIRLSFWGMFRYYDEILQLRSVLMSRFNERWYMCWWV